MNLSTTTFEEAKMKALEGRRFRIRWVFIGANPKTKSGHSEKFWLVERIKDEGPIHVRHGKIGTGGQTRNRGISFQEAMTRASAKMNDGYTFSSAQADMVEQEDKQSISVALAAPWNRIRSIDNEGNALDENGNFIVKVTRAQALGIQSRYLLE